MLQQTNVASATLLPFLALLVKTEELRTDLELDVLILLVRLHLNLVLQLDHRLKLGVVLSLSALHSQLPVTRRPHTVSTGSFFSCSSDMLDYGESCVRCHEAKALHVT